VRRSAQAPASSQLPAGESRGGTSTWSHGRKPVPAFEAAAIALQGNARTLALRNFMRDEMNAILEKLPA